MSDSEDRLRLIMRARVWDVLSVAPDGLPEPLEERAEDCRYEAVLLVRPRGSGPPGAPALAVLSLAEAQRYLPGLALSDFERGVVAALRSAGNRRHTMPQLQDLVEARSGVRVPEATCKILLARMTSPAVGMLENSRTARPPGYRVTAQYLAFLRWIEAEGTPALACEPAAGVRGGGAA